MRTFSSLDLFACLACELAGGRAKKPNPTFKHFEHIYHQSVANQTRSNRDTDATCPFVASTSKYRTVDGSCKNLVHICQLPPDHDARRRHSDEERVYHVHQVQRHTATRLREQPERTAELWSRFCSISRTINMCRELSASRTWTRMRLDRIPVSTALLLTSLVRTRV